MLSNSVIGFMVIIASLILPACSTTEVVKISGPTPEQLSRNPDQSVKGQRLTWGGEIISLRNKPDRTLVEVLAYPLNKSGEPLLNRKPLGRFLADHTGFLEPMEYTKGKRITVSGPLLGYKDGRIGDSHYTYPALDAQDITLYERVVPSTFSRQPRVSVGVGVGSWGSNVGIGIGF